MLDGLKILARTAAAIGAELEKQRSEQAVAKAELEKLDAITPREILRLDDDALDEIERQRTRQRRAAKRTSVAISLLEKELVAVRVDERKSEWAGWLQKLSKSARACSAAARALHDAVADFDQLRGQAARAGFQLDVDRVPPFPYILNVVETHQPQVKAFEDGIAVYLASPTSKVAIEIKRHDTGTKEPIVARSFGGEAAARAGLAERPKNSTQHGVRLYSIPSRPGAARPPAQPAAPPPFQPRAPRPALPLPPLPETPPAGHVRVRVLQGGYCDGGGFQRARGDLLDLPEFTAAQAAARSAVEIVDPEQLARIKGIVGQETSRP